MSNKDDDKIIVELFRDASKHLGDYVYTLLRVGGAEYHEKDPLCQGPQISDTFVYKLTAVN